MNRDRASTITNPQLKEGYKQTEVGIIPEDWEITSLDSVAKLSSGTTPARVQEERYFRNGTYYWVKTTDLNNSRITKTEEKITKAALDETCLQMYPPGTVLVAMYGGFNQIGRTGLIQISAAVNQALVAIQANPRKLDPTYLLVNLNYRVEYWKSVASSSRKDPNITSQDIRNFLIPLPPLAEQEAIACTLSDIDALIESLDRLLTKKRQIKQGAMQELLTGKRRLMGFSGEWESKTFGNIFNYQATATNSRSDLSENGNTYYIHYGDIHMKFHSHLDFNYDCPPKINRKLCENATLLQNGDWIMADASEDLDGVGKSVEIIGLDDSISVIAGLHTFVLREKIETFAPKFKGHLGNLKSLHDELLRVATGMKVFGISKTALKELTLPVPPIPEQIEIANILSDMDAEIGSIESKLAKTRQLKQGMMHELLTGRIRLVDPIQ